MRHYVLHTYHGPLVFTQRTDDWIISSPCRPPEIFDGTIPPSCLHTARRITTDEAVEIVGDCSIALYQDGAIDRQLAVVA